MWGVLIKQILVGFAFWMHRVFSMVLSCHGNFLVFLWFLRSLGDVFNSSLPRHAFYGISFWKKPVLDSRRRAEQKESIKKNTNQSQNTDLRKPNQSQNQSKTKAEANHLSKTKPKPNPKPKPKQNQIETKPPE